MLVVGFDLCKRMVGLSATDVVGTVEVDVVLPFAVDFAVGESDFKSGDVAEVA